MAKPGPKPRIWTDEERRWVQRMALAMIPQENIAKVLKTTKETLEKYFPDELDCSKPLSGVVGALFKNAMEGNVTAQIFICKTRLGWREKSEIEHSGNVAITPLIQLTTKETK